MVKLLGVAVLFASGLVLAGGLAAVGVADITTTETIPLITTVSETATAPTIIVTPVELTTPQGVIFPPPTPTPSTAPAGSPPTWVWVLVTILPGGGVALLIAPFARRGSGRQ